MFSAASDSQADEKILRLSAMKVHCSGETDVLYIGGKVLESDGCAVRFV